MNNDNYKHKNGINNKNTKHNNTKNIEPSKIVYSNAVTSERTLYPTSVNGQTCVGPCYYSNTHVIHPLTLEEIEGVEHNFCPVNTFIYTNSLTGKSKSSNIDLCFVPTARETIVLTPQFSFSSEYFVKVYYKINNIEDLLKWLEENREAPHKTKERVFNNSMIAYGEHLNIIDHRLVRFINDIMLEYLPKIYRHIKYYFIVDNNSQTIKLVDSKEDTNDETSTHHISNIAVARDYIKEKFLGSDNIHQFMTKFIRYYKEDITSKNLSNLLVDHMIDYITKRIKLTLDQ
jgi:hypothetical protein